MLCVVAGAMLRPPSIPLSKVICRSLCFIRLCLQPRFGRHETAFLRCCSPDSIQLLLVSAGGRELQIRCIGEILMVAFSLFCGFAILMIALFRILLEAHVEGEERAVLLAHEMKHRSSNLLGMVQAISAQTARNASTFAEYQCLFTSRLAALAQAQQLFVENSGSPPDLRQFLKSIIEPFDAARFQIDGPDVTVPPYLGTCLPSSHELATNATKYGALSSPDGIVHHQMGYAEEPRAPGVAGT